METDPEEEGAEVVPEEAEASVEEAAEAEETDPKDPLLNTPKVEKLKPKNEISEPIKLNSKCLPTLNSLYLYITNSTVKPDY